MLRVVYEVADLKPSQPVRMSEDRGVVTVLIDRNADAVEYANSLNLALDRFLSEAQWFQLWRDEIVSRSSAGSPLRVEYIVDDLDPGLCVEIREKRGLVRIHVERSATAAQFVAALNPAIEEFLLGGQWFQLWQGEIVDMASPDTLKAEA